MAKTLVDIFRLKGHHAHVAHRAADALEMVKETKFDCVLSDVKMPDTNGVELYKAIKKTQPELPVMLMTAYSEDHLVKEGLAEGVVDVLTKPLNISDLLSYFYSLSQ
jgi:two-component system response regulator (stage 0 sporulation protein F)